MGVIETCVLDLLLWAYWDRNCYNTNNNTNTTTTTTTINNNNNDNNQANKNSRDDLNGGFSLVSLKLKDNMRDVTQCSQRVDINIHIRHAQTRPDRPFVYCT